MSTLTIAVDDAKLQQLQETAQRLGVPVEDLVAQSIDEYLTRRQRFEEAADYLLKKNAELYRRLAQ